MAQDEVNQIEIALMDQTRIMEWQNQLMMIQMTWMKKKTDFLKKLTNVDRNELQLRTIEQSHSQEWHNERKKRLTASNFGDICKMRANTSCRNKVYSLLYKPNFLSKEMMHGVEMESFARNSFEKLSDKNVQLCELFSDNEFPYLAASPGITLQIIIYF